MIEIGILTLQDGYNRGPCDFFPLIRWEKEFENRGFRFHFFKSHHDKRLFDNDIVFIDHRYYRDLIIIKNIYLNKKFIKNLIRELKSKDIKVILFDNGDGSGGRQWDLISEVDVLVKKQILGNKKDYTLNKGVFSYMPFLEQYELSESTRQNNLYKTDYEPCPSKYLKKIKLGWNIGMKDYRVFPMSQYYPIGTSRLFNKRYKLPSFENPRKNRPIDSSFRGQLKHGNENYAYQRNKVIEMFTKVSNHKYITGNILPKKEYLDELKRSKTCVSPFGWGEVCYRDFESIINGAILIKPDMDHLETFPDIYKKNETYIPLKWDMSDLEKVLVEVINNYGDYIPVIENAQNKYKEAITDYTGFIDHFKNIIDEH